MNLLLNAADAIGERGGTIRLASRARALPPRGHEPIRRAVCPNGCDLLDPEHARRRPAGASASCASTAAANGRSISIRSTAASTTSRRALR